VVDGLGISLDRGTIVVSPGTETTEPSLIRGSAVLELSSTNPLAGHGGRLEQRVGCGVSHGLPLAVVTRVATRWRVTRVKSRVRCRD